ncbi:hypothetical protein [Variovorax ginsengisoli]|uniref:DUF6242 domain-containing protein n=1 Tax=Variovorax ginsengisoli TaxID=363844 RepID=A0ABT8SBL5_9BURK|nr:hypothetical protein [Variovorax ginsengisoli]MDN8617138.1 hypothetical protein [Variovorax ginsengisoli]MDO1536308.1 hypothetical protein [Variovorax ginsengisoli]
MPASGSPTSSAGAWLSFKPAIVDLTVFPQTSTPFSVAAVSSRSIAQTVNIAIIDTKGVITPNVKISGGGLQYVASMSTNPDLVPGSYSGSFEVRVCYDANPLVCTQPVEGSPWQLPYKIRVLDPAEFSYASWEEVPITPSFRDKLFTSSMALSVYDGKPLLVLANGTTGVMETYISPDFGTKWSLQAIPGPTPLTSRFALSSDGAAVYLSGGSYPYRNHVWKFDGVAWQRQTASAEFPARERHLMAKVGTTLFMAGGSNGGVSPLRDLWTSTDEGITWSKRTDSLPAALGVVTCALNWRGSLLLIGDAVATSPDGVQWTVQSGYPVNFPKRSRYCAVLNDKLIIATNGQTLTELGRPVQSMSTTDLVNWHLEPNRSRISDIEVPNMVAVDGRLLMFAGQSTSELTLYRTVR